MDADTRTLRRLRRSRRLLAAALAAGVTALPFPDRPALAAQVTAPAPGTLALDAAQLQSAAEPAFPRSEKWLGGLATLTLSQPRIAIPGGGDRIQLDLDYQVALATGDSERGRFRVASGLRYDPATRGLHLLEPELQSLQADGHAGALDERTRGMLNAMLEDYARKEPIYRLDAETLAQVPGTLGADAVRIRDGQVHVTIAR